MSWATSLRYQALFAQVGGLAAGNDVTVSGIKVGTVTDVALDDGQAMVSFTIKGTVRLGDSTTAHIRTGSLLGQRMLTLESAGRARLHPIGDHPDLTDVLPILDHRRRRRPDHRHCRYRHGHTQPVSGHPVGHDRPDRPKTGSDIRRGHPAVAGSQRPQPHTGRTVQKRTGSQHHPLGAQRADEHLDSQRQRPGGCPGRSAASHRRVAQQHLGALAKQLSGVIHDNEAELAPTLDKLNAVTAVLEKNRDNIAKSLPGLAQYELTTGSSAPVAPTTRR